jgi:hypothetical protein
MRDSSRRTRHPRSGVVFPDQVLAGFLQFPSLGCGSLRTSEWTCGRSCWIAEREPLRFELEPCRCGLRETRKRPSLHRARRAR